MTFRDIDKGWGRIVRDLKGVSNSYTKVGVQQGSTHKKKSEDSGTPISDLVVIAAVN